METQPIRPTAFAPPVQRTTNNGKGSQGAFDRAFAQAEGGEGEQEATPETPAPSELQIDKPAIRKELQAGEHQIDVVV